MKQPGNYTTKGHDMSTAKPARKRVRKITERKAPVGTITTTVLPDGMAPGHPLITEYPRRLRWDEEFVILQTEGACRPRKAGKHPLTGRQLYRMVKVTLLHVAGSVIHQNVWVRQHREKNAAVRVATAITVCQSCPVISLCESYADGHPATDGTVLAGRFYGKGRGAKVNGKIADPGIKDLMDEWNDTVQGQTPKGTITKRFIRDLKTKRPFSPTKIRRHMDGTITEYSPLVESIQAVAVEITTEKLRDLNNDLAAERFDDEIMPVLTDSIRDDLSDLMGELFTR